ncbi:MAG: hypothetical protein C5B59_20960 [Bacteroidetes bacterium]|nr:MAG: hypothetical protein C5B59_20960 [Bacteroidota bacterium]
MEKTNDISKELLEISELLGKMTRINFVYQVPAGYFENLPEQLISRLRQMRSASQVTDELKDLSPLLNQLEKKNPYEVPENYFFQFPAEMMQVLQSMSAPDLDAKKELEGLSTLLSQADKKNPYETPPGYFTDLPENLAGALRAVSFVKEELKHASPLSDQLRNEKTYSVPEGYFDGLAAEVLEKIKSQPSKARIIPMKEKRSWLKYAVAAAITGTILTVGILTYQMQNKPADDPAIGLTKVSDKEIADFLKNQVMPMTEPSNNNNNTTASIDFGENDIKDLLGDVSDNELQDYMNEQAGTRDIQTN